MSTKVTDVIDQPNIEWLRNLKIIPISTDCTPAHFLYKLFGSLFPNAVFPNEKDDRKKLQEVRGLVNKYGIRSVDHWSPILYLSDHSLIPAGQNGERNASDVINEGITRFNKVIRNLRFFLTSDQEFRKTLEKDLKARAEKCTALASQMEHVADENVFYRGKIDQIISLLEVAPPEDRTFGMDIINKMFEKNLNSERGRSLTTIGRK